MQLLERFRKSLLESGCIPTGSRVLVAISGGADSVALLSLLCRVAEPMALQILAAHLDHALREASSDDARFVERLCLELDVPLTTRRVDVAEVACQRKGNLEEVARDLRRDFLLSTAQALNCEKVALAHHADDQAETFLMRLLRGSGPSGLAGMRMVSQAFVRPLLPFRKAEIHGYLQEEELAWREDESNLDLALTRNRIRHNLLPLLESYNPNIGSQLAGLCEQMRQDDEFWVVLAARELSRCGSWQEDGTYCLDRASISELVPALASRVLRAALHEVRGNLRGVTAGHVADIVKLLKDGAPQGELDLPGVWIARRYEKLLLRADKPATVTPYTLCLAGPGVYDLPDQRRLRLTLEERPLGESRSAVEYAAAALCFPLQLRHCQPGDRFQPSGLEGRKKLQDLFVDLKLTKEDRLKTLLLLMDDKVLWVVGLRRAEGLRPGRQEPVVRIVIEPCA